MLATVLNGVYRLFGFRAGMGIIPEYGKSVREISWFRSVECSSTVFASENSFFRPWAKIDAGEGQKMESTRGRL